MHNFKRTRKPRLYDVAEKLTMVYMINVTVNLANFFMPVFPPKFARNFLKLLDMVLANFVDFGALEILHNKMQESSRVKVQGSRYQIQI